ncbi:MAG: DNA-3-methyladenine glycosylase [Gammaproteobacteria bacterium]|nr:DNA-3-methyladenine glycosylase [Gammaproteobacteria bacterium]
MSPILSKDFFNQDACLVAQQLLGKILRVRFDAFWLSAKIIETEAYYIHDKASHASLGYTEKRKALFMPPGTIYMYYARGGDSLNFSCQGEGNAVLIKSAFPYFDQQSPQSTLCIMQKLNPYPNGKERPIEKLCAGQTLLCKSLHLKVPQWDQKELNPENFYLEDIHYYPNKIIQTKRLGIPKGRDEALFYRFIDRDYAKYCTRNPIIKTALLHK